jgi:hypothetical protein
MEGNAELRRLLNEMTHDLNVKSHRGLLTAISTKISNTVRILPSPADEPLENFNCVMYALGLVGALEHPCSPLGRFYAGTAFISSLISDGKLRPCEPDTGALVTWSSLEDLKHVGVLLAPDRAVSKWGIGYLYEHALLELPTTFGNQLAFYGALDADAALEHLHQFLVATGVLRATSAAL